jgi:hypothetical protein
VVPGETYDPPQLNGADMVDLFSYTSASPLDLDSDPVYTTQGDIGKYLVLVCEAETDVTIGVKSGDSLTIAWEAA